MTSDPTETENGVAAAPVDGATPATQPVPADAPGAAGGDAAEPPVALAAEEASTENASPEAEPSEAEPSNAEAADAEPAEAASDTPADDPDAPPPAQEEGEVERIRALFTRSPASTEAAAPPDEDQTFDGAAPEDPPAASGAFYFARWSRPIAPRLFGVEPQSVDPIMAGLAEAAKRAGLDLVEEDPEFGVNLLIFFCDEWAELKSVPGMERLVPDIGKLVSVLAATGANQYRIFSFSPAGGVRLAVVLLRYDDDMARFSPKALGLGQMTQTLLLWSDAAFVDETPLAVGRRGDSRLKPWFGDLLSAAYDPETPDYSEDPALAERLAFGVAARRAAARRSAASSKRRNSKRGEPAARAGAATVVEEPIEKTADPSSTDVVESDAVELAAPKTEEVSSATAAPQAEDVAADDTETEVQASEVQASEVQASEVQSSADVDAPPEDPASSSAEPRFSGAPEGAEVEASGGNAPETSDDADASAARP